MGENDTVLLANEGFYRAFAGGDVAAMDELWAHDGAVACIHPGWTPLSGREQVMASWQAILSAGPPHIRCRHARAHVRGQVAFVTCCEAIGRGLLAATNIFVREGAEWKMVHHQAGPMASTAPGEEEKASGVVH